MVNADEDEDVGTKDRRGLFVLIGANTVDSSVSAVEMERWR